MLDAPALRELWSKREVSGAQREGIVHLRAVMWLSIRRASAIIGVDRTMIRYRWRRPKEGLEVCRRRTRRRAPWKRIPRPAYRRELLLATAARLSPTLAQPRKNVRPQVAHPFRTAFVCFGWQPKFVFAVHGLPSEGAWARG